MTTESSTVMHIIVARTDDNALCGLKVQDRDRTLSAFMTRDAYLRHHAGQRYEAPRFCVECKVRADAA